MGFLTAVLYGSSGGEPVEVVVHVDDGWVQASVLDHGPDPAPVLSADTDEPDAGGRGLWLLRRLVDEVRLERVRLGTRVTLRRAIRQRGHWPLAWIHRNVFAPCHVFTGQWPFVDRRMSHQEAARLQRRDHALKQA